MANSSITLDYNSPAELGDRIVITDTVNNTEIRIIYETAFPTGFFIQISGNIDQDILETKNHLEAVYNNSNAFTITANTSSNKLTIVDNSGTKFFEVSENNTSGRITVGIANETPTEQIKITNFSISENATDPCNLYDATITTNVDATQLTSPVSQSVSSNPFTVIGLNRDDVDRLNFSLNNNDTSTSYTDVFTPKLTANLFTLKIIANINNSYSLNISYGLSSITNSNYKISYSINDIDYYSSSSFSGLTTGSYTLYVKDNIGCSASIPFQITEQELNVYDRVPVFKVSQHNALISVRRNERFQNPTNMLSYEERGLNRKDFKQLFESTDGILTQQFNSSYESVEVKLHDCQGNENTILTTQKTDNYDITDVRDVTITTVNYLNQSYIAIKYVSGNTYDPDTLGKTGEYFLGSLVPEFMNTNDGIILQGVGTYRVQDIVFKDNVQVLVLDILAANFPITPNGVILKATTKYNQLDYNVFEYSIDLSTLNGDYYVTYKAFDSEFDTIEEQTEWFNISNEQNETFFLEYYHTENNETLYSTGIKNFIRIPYDLELEYIPRDTQTTYDTDTNSVSLETTYRDAYRMYIADIPQGMERKIGIATSNNRLFIDGMSVIKAEEIESESIKGTNLYKMNILFHRSDYVNKSNSSNGSIVLPSGQALNIGNNGVGFLLVN